MYRSPVFPSPSLPFSSAPSINLSFPNPFFYRPAVPLFTSSHSFICRASTLTRISVLFPVLRCQPISSFLFTYLVFIISNKLLVIVSPLGSVSVICFLIWTFSLSWWVLPGVCIQMLVIVAYLFCLPYVDELLPCWRPLCLCRHCVFSIWIIYCVCLAV